MLFLQQLRGELRKLFARPRTWMGYGAFLIMEAVILLVYKLPRSQEYMHKLLDRNGLEFATYYSSLTITFTIMLLSMFLLGSMLCGCRSAPPNSQCSTRPAGAFFGKRGWRKPPSRASGTPLA